MRLKFFILFLMLANLAFSQTPNSFNYQTVLRNSSGAIIANQQVGIEIKISKTSAIGLVVYEEKHLVTSNQLGLINLKIGEGINTIGSINNIEWAQGPYFVNVSMDLNNTGTYSFVGSMQLLSVPYALYALYAKKAENGFSGNFLDLTNTPSLIINGDSLKLGKMGQIKLPSESDPLFNSSIAKGINANDTIYWNKKLSSFTELDPLYNTSIAKGINANDTIYWNRKLSSFTELDPIYNSSIAKGINANDTIYWNRKLSSFTELDPVYNASVAKGIKATDTSYWNRKLSSFTELDPIYNASVAKGIKATDTTYWNKKLSSFTEIDPIYNSSVAKGITNNMIVSWNKDTSTINEIQTISFVNDSILLSKNGGRVYVPISKKAEKMDDLTDAVSDTAKNNLILNGSNLSLYNGTNLTVIGHKSLTQNTTGSKNIVLGASSLQKNKAGSNNIVIGANALNNNIDSSNNIVIGNSANTKNANIANSIVIGNDAIAKKSNTMQLGNDALLTIETKAILNAKGAVMSDSMLLGTSSVLALNSNTKGFLPPRMTKQERDNILQPIAGLMVWCTNCGTSGEIQTYNGTNWSSGNFSPVVTMPTVTTNAATEITDNSVVLNGVIISDGGSLVTSKGFQIALDANFSNGLNTITINNQGVGTINFSQASLVSGTSYYFRTFAVNAIGTSYAQTASFVCLNQTPTSTLPLITLDSIRNITTQSALFYGNVISSGASNITQRGFCFDTIANPTINSPKSTGASTTGLYSYLKNSLISNGKKYYVRAYATNTQGTAYSNQITFNTALLTGNASSLVLGQSYGGGILFYIAPDGQSGLVVTSQNIGNYPWGCSGTLVNNTSKGLGAGNNNTNAILGVCTANSAAKACQDLISGGCDDWYLPSWDELILMRENLHAVGIGSLSGWTWSSSETDETIALAYDWSCGNVMTKTNVLGVRAIRRFSINNTTSTPTLSINGISKNAFHSVTISGSFLNTKIGEVYEKGFCIGTSNNPTINNQKYSAIDFAPYGCSPIINKASYTNNVALTTISGLNQGTTYYARPYAISISGVYYGSSQSFTTTAVTLSAGNGVTDVEGNTYSSVIIGTKEWMSSNLRTSKYRNGDNIPYSAGGSPWTSLTTGAFTYYQLNPTYNLTLGKLYNWFAVNDTRNLCPQGWHISTNDEWTNLEILLGGPTLAGGALKSKDLTYWEGANTGATNIVGFNGIGAGKIDSDFGYKNHSSWFWTSTSLNTTNAFYRAMEHGSADLPDWHGRNYTKTAGFSCRCVKD